jgi:hypothetical protein
VAFIPLSHPIVVGEDVVGAFTNRVTTAADGGFTNSLNAGDYDVQAGVTKKFRITVPDDALLYLLTELIVTNAYWGTNITGAIRVNGSGVVTIPSNFWLANSNSVNAVVNWATLTLGSYTNLAAQVPWTFPGDYGSEGSIWAEDGAGGFSVLGTTGWMRSRLSDTYTSEGDYIRREASKTNVLVFEPTPAAPSPVLGEAPLYAGTNSAGAARLMAKSRLGTFSQIATEADVLELATQQLDVTADLYTAQTNAPAFVVESGKGGLFVPEPASWSLGTIFDVSDGGGLIGLQPIAWAVASGGTSGYTTGTGYIYCTNLIGVTTYVTTNPVHVVASAGVVTAVKSTNYAGGVYTGGKFLDSATNIAYYVHQTGSSSNATLYCYWFRETLRDVCGGTGSPARVAITHVTNGAVLAARMITNGVYSVQPGTDVGYFRTTVALTNGPVTLLALTNNGSGVATAKVTQNGHYFQNGDRVTISGADNAAYNISTVIYGIAATNNATTFSYAISTIAAGTNAATATAVFSDTSAPQLTCFVRGKGGLYHASQNPGWWWRRDGALNVIESKWFGATGTAPTTPSYADRLTYDEWDKLQAMCEGAAAEKAIAQIDGGNYLILRPLVIDHPYELEYMEGRTLQGAGMYTTRITYGGTYADGPAIINLQHWVRAYSGGVEYTYEGRPVLTVQDFTCVSPTYSSWTSTNYADRWFVNLGEYRFGAIYRHGRSGESLFKNLLVRGFLAATNATWGANPYGVWTNAAGAFKFDYTYGMTLDNVKIQYCHMAVDVASDTDPRWTIADAAPLATFASTMEFNNVDVIMCYSPYGACNFRAGGPVRWRGGVMTGQGPIIRMHYVFDSTLNHIYFEDSGSYPKVVLNNCQVLMDSCYFGCKTMYAAPIIVADTPGFNSYNPNEIKNCFFNTPTTTGTLYITNLQMVATNSDVRLATGLAYEMKAICTNFAASGQTAFSNAVFKINGVSSAADSWITNEFYVVDRVSSNSFHFWTYSKPLGGVSTNCTAVFQTIPVQLGHTINTAIHWGEWGIDSPTDISGCISARLTENSASSYPYWSLGLDQSDYPVTVIHNGITAMYDTMGRMTYQHGTDGVTKARESDQRVARTRFGGHIDLSLTNAAVTVTATTILETYPPLQRLIASGGGTVTVRSITNICCYKDQIMALAYEAGSAGTVVIPATSTTDFPGSVAISDGDTVWLRYNGSAWEIMSEYHNGGIVVRNSTAPAKVAGQATIHTSSTSPSSAAEVGSLSMFTGGNASSALAVNTDGTSTGWRFVDAQSFCDPSAVSSDSTTISPTARLVRLAAGSSYTLNSTPTITAGNVGQIIVLTMYDSAGTVVLQDAGTLTGSGLELGASTRTVTGAATLQLIYDGTAWKEISYSAN